MSRALIGQDIRNADDVALAHQQAALLSEELGLTRLQQACLCVVLLQVAQHALRFGPGGRVDFSLEDAAPTASAPTATAWLSVKVSDQGRGITEQDAVLQGGGGNGDAELELANCKALLPDYFTVDTGCGPNAQGTQVQFGQSLATSSALTAQRVQAIRQALAALPAVTPLQALANQHRALLSARQGEQTALAGVEQELATTNSGVVALYLDLNAKTQAAERANAALEAFNYAVSHDLRAPLRGIDGWSLALQEDYAQRLDDEGRLYLQRIRRDVQHMNQLIEALLRLSRVSTGAMHTDLVDMAALATTIVERLRERMPQRHVEVLIASPLLVQGDAALLEIALSNLLDNAWKFTAHTPHARIEFGSELAPETGERCYVVRDNGVGFDMSYAQKLFAPFQRLHSAEDFPGTGIGLAIVQRIVQRHGGRIWVASAPGQGTRFYFVLGGAQ